MGGLRHLLGLSKSSEPNPEDQIPSLSTEIVKLPEPWQGNLPCVHGPSDGCSNHNPAQDPIHFDSSLFGPNAHKIKPSGNRRSDSDPNHIVPEIQSRLPRSLDSLAVLPRVHKSVPWSLSFYHVHAAMENPSAISTLLSCSSVTGNNPPLSWIVTPLLAPDKTTLLVEYDMAFTLQADLGSWTESTQHGRAISKEMLIGSGFRDFTPCPHTHLAFTSHRGEGKNHTRYAGVSYTRKKQRVGSTKWREEKGEWRSEINEEIPPMHCPKCYTDTHLSFGMVGSIVVVNIQVYKDLGEGLHPSDPKWLALTRGVDLDRLREEPIVYRSIKKAFMDASPNP